MGKRLFVGNLAYGVTEAALQELFSSIGPVESVKVITDRDTGRSRGFGFVEMANDEDAVRAIAELRGKPYQGRVLTVNEAKPMEPREGGGGGRGPDSGSGGGRRFGGGANRW